MPNSLASDPDGTRDTINRLKERGPGSMVPGDNEKSRERTGTIAPSIRSCLRSWRVGTMAEQWKSTPKMTKDKDSSQSEIARGKAKAGGPGQGADSSVERAIGSRLRAYYDELSREPVPDRFVDLLKRLDDDSAGR